MKIKKKQITNKINNAYGIGLNSYAKIFIILGDEKMNYKKEIIRLKRKLNKKQFTVRVLFTSCIILTFVCLGFIICMGSMIHNYKTLETKCERLIEQNNSTLSVSTDKDDSIEQLRDIINEQDAQLQAVSDINKGYVDELNTFRNRQELYDKYSYAVINEMGERTELTYAQIKLGEELMLEKGYDPNLLFGTIMVESRGNPDCVNTESGATGLGQFMNSTAEYVWCTLMGNDYYDPEIMKDPESNIKMMACYYDYLYKTEGDTFNVVKKYSGNITDWGTLQYIQKINNFTCKVGVVIF